MGELGQEFWRIRYRNFDDPGVRSTRTSYGTLEKIVHGILDGVHVCFTDPTDRRACMFHRTSWEYHYDRCRHFDDWNMLISVRVHLEVVRNSGIVHESLDGVHVCFTNPTDSTSTTGAASRLLNSVNVQCLLSPIVGAKSRLLETFDLNVDGGKPLLLVEFAIM